MAILTLVENEKALQQETKNIFVLRFDKPQGDINSIELKKKLAAMDIVVDDVRVVNPPIKFKQRARKGGKRTTVAVKRPKKFYVRLAEGSVFPEGFSLTV